jgi:hypothetical protein
LAKMVEWARGAGIRSTPKFENIEIDENLPPSWRQ